MQLAHSNHSPTGKVLYEANLDRKTTHKGCDLVNALKDKRLKVKKGTQRTFVRVIYYESCIVPM